MQYSKICHNYTTLLCQGVVEVVGQKKLSCLGLRSSSSVLSRLQQGKIIC
jgi:hypothetical protein